MEILASIQKLKKVIETAEVWPLMKQAGPNCGHRFVKELYDSQKLLGVITQNIDGLHEKSGIPSEKTVYSLDLDKRNLHE
ncbi:MAG: Sir2 family NAD-dependent protein deacetylase [Spirochaetia bacterium]